MNKSVIIAELSANHNGSKATAIETIKAAKRAGANAIKLQTDTPDTITLNCQNDDFKINQGTLWDGNFFYDLYMECYSAVQARAYRKYTVQGDLVSRSIGNKVSTMERTYIRELLNNV
jgi:sialic acid synthase SpsE